METPGKDDSRGGHSESHSPFLAHHFQTPQQQFAAGKLGMWIFLVTEVLLFGGLFCAYAVYRAHHPEIFAYAAEEFLDKRLGALNTGVLIFSSFTMAWAVRCAQLNRRQALVTLLAITLACGFVFLSVKYVEYKHKWEEGLLWAAKYSPAERAAADSPKEAPAGKPAAEEKAETAKGNEASGAAAGQTASTDAEHAQRSQIISRRDERGKRTAERRFLTEPKHVGVFFSIYFAMTGLHGLHVMAGMAAIAWVLRRSVLGHFSSVYFGPVDYVGLYWHLVDLIWIFLFPLLYLIH